MILSARLRCLSVLALICVGGVHAPAQTAEAIAEYSDLGQKALFAQGKYAEAEAAFEKLRELEPGVAEVHANTGAWIYSGKGNSNPPFPRCARP